MFKRFSWDLPGFLLSLFLDLEVLVEAKDYILFNMLYDSFKTFYFNFP